MKPRTTPSPRLPGLRGIALLLAAGLWLAGPALAQRDRDGRAAGGTRTNVSHDVNRNANAGRDLNANHNTNVNRNTNVNVNRSANVHVDVDDDYHPFATAAAVTAGVAVTAAVVGSVTRSLPPSCAPVLVNGITYQQCGGAWYQPQYAGTQVTYVVVNAPR